jgi:nucleoside-diphosphate-sugar epimerase
MNKWLIFGAGFSGIEVGACLAGHGANVAGTTRDSSKFPKLETVNIAPFLYNNSVLSEDLRAYLKTATHLLMSIGPDEGGDPWLPMHKEDLHKLTPNLKWIGYLSTVGVYGDHDGAWVFEETPPKPVSIRSFQRLRTEQDWQTFADEKRVPLCILRLSGIYGKGRNGFVNLMNGTAKRVIKPNQVFNRIHVKDIAGAVKHLSDKNLSGIFNVTDSEPAPPQDVVTFCADLMGIKPPAEIAYDDAKMSQMARSFYGEVKRVSNAKLLATGYEFLYPDYKAAFTTMWQLGTWK